MFHPTGPLNDLWPQQTHLQYVPLFQGINKHIQTQFIFALKRWATQIGCTKSLRDTRTDWQTHWLTHSACSHKVFPNGRPNKEGKQTWCREQERPTQWLQNQDVSKLQSRKTTEYCREINKTETSRSQVIEITCVPRTSKNNSPGFVIIVLVFLVPHSKLPFSFCSCDGCVINDLVCRCFNQLNRPFLYLVHSYHRQQSKGKPRGWNPGRIRQKARPDNPSTWWVMPECLWKVLEPGLA